MKYINSRKNDIWPPYYVSQTNDAKSSHHQPASPQ